MGKRLIQIQILIHRPSGEISMPSKGVPSKLLQHEKKKKPKTAKPSKPSAYGEETDTNTDTDTDRPSLPKTGTREEPSNREKYSDMPHSDIQMPKKGVPSKLLPYEKKEMPKTAKPSTPSTDGEETDDTSTERPFSEIPMPTKGVPSKLLRHERREMPSKPEEEVDGEIPYDSEEQDTPSSRPSPKH